MQKHSRHLIRAGIITGLVLTAIPGIRAPWSPVQHAAAARLEVRGFSQTLMAQAARAPMHMVFMLRPGAAKDEQDILRTLQRTGASDITSLDLINGIAAQVSDRTLSALRYNPDLQEVTVDRMHQPLPTPDYADLSEQLARADLQSANAAPAGQQVIQQPDTLSIIHADAVHKHFTGRGVRVAVIDSGVDYGHPDLQGIMLKDASGKPLYADFTGTDLTDTVGHGTAVSGTIAAQARTVYSVNNTYRVTVYPPPNPTVRFNNRTYFTMGGVAPGVKLMVGKIFDTRLPGQGGYDSTIVRAIQWAIANHADVISESFGQTAVVQTNSNTDVVALADEAAVRAGITVVAADGNTGPGQSSVSSPAQAPDVIAAGASTDFSLFAQTGRYANYGAATADNIASFTSLGPTYDGRIRPDVFAPGSFGWAPVPRNPSEESPSTPPYLLEAFGGTSMATPVVAGTAALVINAYMETHGGRHPSPAYVKQVITSSADNMGYPAGDQAAGRVNAERAVDTVTGQGPSVLLSGALALRGQSGQHPSSTIAVTNSGSTPERVTFEPQMTRTVQSLSFGGMTIADNFSTYKFNVPAGIAKLTAAVYWDNQRSVPVSGQQGIPVSLRVRLYDPQGNFVNYQVPGDSGAGNARTTAGRPVPGLWTALVIQSSRQDSHHIAHFSNIPFTGAITMDAFQTQGGRVTPSRLVLQPHQRAKVTFAADTLTSAGVKTVTLHVREQSLTKVDGQNPPETIATIPVVVTTNITMAGGRGTFSGVFRGADDAGVDEVNYFGFTVPPGTKNMTVTIQWPHGGNWFLLALLDPQGRAMNLVDNALATGSSGGNDLTSTTRPTKIDLSQHAIDGFVDAPAAGRWQVEFMNDRFSGLHPSEPYTGEVRFNQPVARLSTDTVAAQAGGNAVPFTIQVRNPGAGLQAYFTYATTDFYTFRSLGGTGGTLQDGPLGVASTQILSYTTNFVPPGTREIISQAKALNSNLPVGISISDPVLLTFTRYGQPAPQTLGGTLSQGFAAVVRGTELPIGLWENTLTLPAGRATGPVYIAASSQAYSLAPNPWIKMDAQLQPDGKISGSGFPAALPGGGTILHGTVTVPDNVALGTYKAHVFVYSFREDKLADLPLAIKVTKAAPAAAPTPDPFLADIASTQYFPEGATGTGLHDEMDLVNPSNLDTHAQIRILTDTGWTTVMRYDLKPHSRTTVNMQPLVGNNQAIAAVVQGDNPIVSGRRITRTGAAGSYSVGTVSPSTRWYFADGYTVNRFDEFLTILNTTTRTAHVHLHLVSDQNDVRDADIQLGPSSRGALRVADLLSGKAVSATVTSDVPVVAERTELFGTQAQGVTTVVGANDGSTASYIDPGHLPAGAQAHLSFLNPHSQTAHVALTLIDGAGKPAHKVALTLKAGHRATVDLNAKYGNANLGALIASDVGVVAEKAAYFGDFKKSQIGGADLLAASTPATHLIFPGGTTAGGSTDYLNLYNPGTTGATATLTVLYQGTRSAQRTLTIPAGRRISVRINDFGLPAGPSSLLVDGVGSTGLFASQTIVNATHTDGSEIYGVAVAGS